MIGRRNFIKLFLAVVSFILSCKINLAATWSSQTGTKTLTKMKSGADNLSPSTDTIVLRVHNPSLSSTHDPFVQQEKLDAMLGKGLKTITGQSSLKQAWLQILKDYKAGDSIAIKPNFNFIHMNNTNLITSPELLNVLVRQFIEVVGVSPSNIVLYDLCKTIPASIKSRIHKQIRYRERFDPKSVLDKIKLRLHLDPAAGDPAAEISMRNPVTDKHGKPLKCFIPKALQRVQHIINVPLLTNHIFIANSGALKNHFGTVRFSNFSSYPEALHGDILNESIADINLHPAIRKKTKLIIADGIKGVFDRGEGTGEKKWLTFNNDFPGSIFLAKDPVAIDSVMAGHVLRERQARNLATLPDHYLRIAADSGLGVNLAPEGSDNGKAKYVTLTV